MDITNELIDEGLYHAEQNSSDSIEKPSWSNSVMRSCRNSVFIKSQDFFRRIPFSSILYLEAAGSYCYVYLVNGTKITISFTLSQTMKHLSEEMFMRVHRSFVINTEYIESYIGNVFYVNGNMIPIGRSYKKDVLAQFNILGNV